MCDAYGWVHWHANATPKELVRRRVRRRKVPLRHSSETEPTGSSGNKHSAHNDEDDNDDKSDSGSDDLTAGDAATSKSSLSASSGSVSANKESQLADEKQHLLANARRYWARLILGTLLFFDTDKTTQPLFSLELENYSISLSSSDERLEQEKASAERDLFYDDDTESGPKLIVRLLNSEHKSCGDLLVAAGQSWPAALRAALGRPSGLASFNADATDAGCLRVCIALRA